MQVPPSPPLKWLHIAAIIWWLTSDGLLQVLCGTSLAVASFGMQLQLAPYRQPEANLLKAVRNDLSPLSVSFLRPICWLCQF